MNNSSGKVIGNAAGACGVRHRFEVTDFVQLVEEVTRDETMRRTIRNPYGKKHVSSKGRKKNRELFRTDKRTGDIMLVNRIDREEICKNSLVCNVVLKVSAID